MAQTSAQEGAQTSTPAKVPFRKRFRAWWEGYDLDAEGGKAASEAEAADSSTAQEQPYQRWDEDHLKLLQAVWGERQLWPGDAASVCQLVQPFGLTSAMSLLELGAGLGEPARAMAEAFGVWVTAMERDKELAERGMALSEAAGLGKKAPVEAFDPETYEPRPRAFDCVFSREFFYTVKDKKRLFEALDEGLKPGGQFIFTDFLIREGAAQSSNLKAWRDGEPYELSPWSLERYSKLLTDRHFEVRIKEDLTPKYCPVVLGAWSEFMGGLGRGGGDFRPEALVQEVELWTRRMQALESGALKVYRIYARKPSDGSTP